MRQRADRYGDVRMPKSEAGQRSVPLPPLAVIALKTWKRICPDSEASLAFPNEAGKIDYRANLVQLGLAGATGRRRHDQNREGR